MKRFAKIALGALILAGAATAAAAPASARVVVGLGVPVAAPAAVCSPYSRFYDPYYCGPAYAAPMVTVGGVFGGWHDGWHDGFHGGFHGGFHHR